MCNKCNKPKDCSCNEPILKGCLEKLELLCTYYSGPKLDPLNIEAGMTGNEVLKKINEFLITITPQTPTPATLTAFGVVGQSEGVANITTQDATDLASALILINELKLKLNQKLTSDRNSGQQNEI